MSASSQKAALTQFVKDRLAKLAIQENAPDVERAEIVNDNLLFLKGAKEVLTALGVPEEDAAPVTKAVILLDARLDLDETLGG